MNAIATTPPSRLQARGLRLGYGARTIVDGLDLDIPTGAVTAVVGPNGCGKSTLLRSLGRLLAPKAGQVILDGDDIAHLDTREVARRLALLPQSPVAPEGLTVAGLVARGRHPHQSWLRQWSSDDVDVVAACLERTGVAYLADRAVDTLSGGQRQRVWISLVLAQQTTLLLLDEPTTYLDLTGQREFYAMIKELKKQGKTIILILHDLSQAVRISDTLVVMNRAGSRSLDEAAHAGTDSDVKATDFPGSIAMVGTPQECLQSHVIEDVFQTSWKRFTDEDGEYYFFE